MARTLALVLLALSLIPRCALCVCIGDCNGDGSVSVDELLTTVNIALGNPAVSACETSDVNHDDRITIDEILVAVKDALNGCPPLLCVGQINCGNVRCCPSNTTCGSQKDCCPSGFSVDCGPGNGCCPGGTRCGVRHCF